MRMSLDEVLSNIEGVLTEIQNASAVTPTPDPSPQGGGELRRSRAGRPAIRSMHIVWWPYYRACRRRRRWLSLPIPLPLVGRG